VSVSAGESHDRSGVDAHAPGVARHHVLCAIVVAAGVFACGAPVSTPAVAPTGAPSTVAGSAAPTRIVATAELTKPPNIQPQLPLPTTVRWAVDKGSPDDPQHRSLLVFFYDGNARGWRIIDPNGDLLFHVPIAGSGIFGPETCVARARRFDEVTTWIALDRPTLELFLERYRTLRGVAEGIPAGEVTLSLSDSGCRG